MMESKAEQRATAYIIDENGNPKPADIIEMARWMAQHRERRVVARTDVDGATVSTVFLGIDHAFYGGPPVLWETMIYRVNDAGHTEWDDFQERYVSREDALAGHRRAVATLKAIGAR